VATDILVSAGMKRWRARFQTAWGGIASLSLAIAGDVEGGLYSRINAAQVARWMAAGPGGWRV